MELSDPSVKVFACNNAIMLDTNSLSAKTSENGR